MMDIVTEETIVAEFLRSPRGSSIKRSSSKCSSSRHPCGALPHGIPQRFLDEIVAFLHVLFLLLLFDCSVVVCLLKYLHRPRAASPYGLHIVIIRDVVLHVRFICVLFILFDCCVCKILTMASPCRAPCLDLLPRRVHLRRVSSCPLYLRPLSFLLFGYS